MIYIDMDGVLAVWDTTATPDDTKRKGYFLEREIEESVKDLIDSLVSIEVPVCILSAVWNAEAANEKDSWLNRYFGDNLQRIYVPYGDNKADYIVGGTGNILIDDHTPNLIQWSEKSNKAIKFMNGINGNGGRWKGLKIDKNMTVSEMMQVILS